MITFGNRQWADDVNRLLRRIDMGDIYRVEHDAGSGQWVLHDCIGRIGVVDAQVVHELLDSGVVGAACVGGVVRLGLTEAARDALAAVDELATRTEKTSVARRFCRVCGGHGADPASDNTNWLPCGACGGTGLAPGEELSTEWHAGTRWATAAAEPTA